jgi:hypothetical protein
MSKSPRKTEEIDWGIGACPFKEIAEIPSRPGAGKEKKGGLREQRNLMIGGCRRPKMLLPQARRKRTVACSHDLVLSEAAMGIGVHVVTTARREVLDVAQAKRTTAVLIGLKLGNGGFRRVRVVEADHTGAARSAARLVLDLGLLDFADGGEELN